MSSTELFNRKFDNLDSYFIQDLYDLQEKGAIFSQFSLENTEELRFCRITFTPEEIVRYVDACTAYNEFLGSLNTLRDPIEALECVSSNSTKELVKKYNKWAVSIGNSDQAFCFAAFMGEDLESLLTGEIAGRYEFFAESYQGDRNYLLKEILEMFPDVAQGLGTRRKDCVPYLLEKEFDIQDLLYAILKCTFPDARQEEYTKQHAGGSKRVDIVLPLIETLIEVKFVRDANHAKGIADELKIDFESYHVHEHSKKIIAYIWDPSHFILDRSNFINDLRGLRTKNKHTFYVDILVKP